MHLQLLTRFMQLIHKLRRVKRNIPLAEGGRENDAEHSYQLAMAAWYFMRKYHLNLDHGKVLKYCLCHDLPEAYAGDVDCLAGKEARAEKERREAEARAKIGREFPDFPELFEMMESYHVMAPDDPEARFVYALDKLLPMNNIRISGQAQWRDQGVPFSVIMEHKERLISPVEALQPVWSELKAELSNYPELFAPEAKQPR